MPFSMSREWRRATSVHSLRYRNGHERRTLTAGCSRVDARPNELSVRVGLGVGTAVAQNGRHKDKQSR